MKFVKPLSIGLGLGAAAASSSASATASAPVADPEFESLWRASAFDFAKQIQPGLPAQNIEILRASLATVDPAPPNLQLVLDLDLELDLDLDSEIASRNAILVASQRAKTTFYVAPTGAECSDSGSGESGSPLCSLEAGLDKCAKANAILGIGQQFNANGDDAKCGIVMQEGIHRLNNTVTLSPEHSNVAIRSVMRLCVRDLNECIELTKTYLRVWIHPSKLNPSSQDMTLSTALPYASLFWVKLRFHFPWFQTRSEQSNLCPSPNANANANVECQLCVFVGDNFLSYVPNRCHCLYANVNANVHVKCQLCVFVGDHSLADVPNLHTLCQCQMLKCQNGAAAKALLW